MDLIKRALFSLLPKSSLKKLKEKHYLSKFRSISGTEEPEMSLLKSLVKSGDHVLDIGANFGAYTKVLSEIVGSKGSVRSFEPIPEMNAYLTSHLDKTGLENVKLESLAVTSFTGKSFFHIPKFSHKGENFYEAHLSDKGELEVSTIKLDDLNFSSKIAFVKCDVEGAELEVLRGGAKFLEEHKPILMLEINDSHQSENGKAIIQFLADYGYQLKFFNSKCLTENVVEHVGVNYFFISQ